MNNPNRNTANKRKWLVSFFIAFALIIGLAIILNIFYPNTFNLRSAIENNPHNITDSPEVQMYPQKITLNQTFTNFDEVAPLVSRCVVGIKTTTSAYSSVGSGVAVADGGIILTNHHVVDGAKNIDVVLADSRSCKATILWQDKALDLAIIKSEINLPYLGFGAAENLIVGERVLAIGTPLSLQFQHTHTGGILSALNRTVAVQTDIGESYMQSLIQHDASINPGNSGGPLINLRGEVIGINTLKLSSAEGIGFAIPVEIAEPVLAHVLEDGSYHTAYIGIYGYDSSIAKYYNKTTTTDGVYVLKVDSSGPCANTNLIEGDIIKSIGEKQIASMLDLRVALYNYKVGDSVNITYTNSSGNSKTESVVIKKHPINSVIG